MTRVVGIAGGSASGKTTVAELFAARTGAVLVTHDRYYRNFADPEVTNFDHPDALETALLVQHLDALRAGRPADLPIYDFTVHRRRPEVDRVPPPSILVVEGILVLTDPDLRDRIDLRVFVDAPADLRFIRRLLRDVRDRGRTMEGVVGQYLATVRPMHEAFVTPSRAWAQVVLDGAGPLDAAVDQLQQAVAHAG